MYSTGALSSSFLVDMEFEPPLLCPSFSRGPTAVVFCKLSASHYSNSIASTKITLELAEIRNLHDPGLNCNGLWGTSCVRLWLVCAAPFLMAQQTTVRRVRALVSVVVLIVKFKISFSNHNRSHRNPNKSMHSSHSNPRTRHMFVNLKQRKRRVVV